MNTGTKKILVLSIIAILLASGVFFSLWYVINSKSMELEKQVEVLSNNNSKELAYLNITKTIKDTKEDRQDIHSKFIKNEDDTIYFLNEIETLASRFGLSFDTVNLNNVMNKGGEVEAVEIDFKYSGEKDEVINFTKLIENIPYHSYAEKLSLKKVTNDVWDGEISIIVTVQSI